MKSRIQQGALLITLSGSMLASTLAFAETVATPPAPGAGQQPPPPGIGSMLLPFAMMFGVVYFLMIRPQQKKMKEQQAMLKALTRGDQVLTASGILGKVADVEDKILTVEIADKVNVRMLKSQVSQVVRDQNKDLA